ncbi:hypothetical protein K458DRAFT_386288 [Lentithecium fluviatile CBS 122367]|uniref:Uncharacterized protein n=1 Tax=Lentithecium fluviatile CBS 122367 TaxID=1168545 RepID=A0A6G1JAB5_9PLEO|nr:hypothetical protein K458DRAFT_386288 [Lentithecium fluviatile CBS 122367]
MAFIRLLQREPNGEIVFREPTSGDVPAYAILSHTWGKEEVIFEDMEANADISKTELFFVDGKVDRDGLDWAFHNLGDFYADQGKLAEAEEMYIRALKGKEEALGLDHTSTLNTVNNLGNLYVGQGKLAEAEKMYIRALQGYEKVLGLDLAASYVPALHRAYNMGLLFAEKGDRDEARRMYTRALAGYRNVFGINHREYQNIDYVDDITAYTEYRYFDDTCL